MTKLGWAAKVHEAYAGESKICATAKSLKFYFGGVMLQVEQKLLFVGRKVAVLGKPVTSCEKPVPIHQN